jgi:selenide,water dikinase
VLDSVLGKLARQHDPNVLVGFDTADDAGVYQLTPGQALVQTVDFFTPIVDDPYTFGQIAAVNSLSDVYAMGGRPLTALAMVCFPEKGDFDVLERILAGGLSKMIEAGCSVVGGHSIRDPEIKFGYSVTGTVHPQRVLTNSRARVGDKLIFTKAIGTGVISTAIKRGQAREEWIAAATASMITLNRLAAEVITGLKGHSFSHAERSAQEVGALAPEERPFEVHALTDVTGFGLIGHSRELALGSNVSVRFFASQIPLLTGAVECVQQGFVPGGLQANRDFAECLVSYESTVPEEIRTLMYDPQTAGGLLVSVAGKDADALLKGLLLAGVPAALIGEVREPQKSTIEVVW